MSAPADAAVHDFLLPESAAGKRLDKALAEALPDYSRSRLKQWLEQGALTVDEATPAPKTAVAGGERIRLIVPETPHDESVEPERMQLNIIHEDASILVLDKPAGLVMHPGAGNQSGTLQNALVAYDESLAALPRAGIVHRLDKTPPAFWWLPRRLPRTSSLLMIWPSAPSNASTTPSRSA